MAGNAKLVVDIITDASKASAGIDQASGKFASFNNTMQGLVGPATAVLGGITALGAVAVNAASDLEQAAGGVDAVFGSSAEQIHDWASEAATAVGLSSAAYSTMAAKLGASLKNMGVPMDQVAGKTDEMIRLGADLAATYGGTTQEAVNALGAALRGEADPAERYGLALNQTAVNAELAARGMGDLEGSALTAAKAQVIMETATAQAGGAIGMFASESDTLAGQQQILNSSIQDTAAALGEALLPMITPVVAALADFAGWVKQNADWIAPLVGIIGILAAAVIAYTAVQWALNVAMSANPIGIVIGLIAGLVAVFIYLWNTSEDFRNFFIGIWDNIVKAMKPVIKIFEDIIANIKKVIDWLSKIKMPKFPDIFGGGKSAKMTYAVTPVVSGGALLYAPRSGSKAVGGNTTINVNGALDPQAVSRQIARMLRARNGRIGLTAAAGIRA